MILKEILSEIESAEKPVVRKLQNAAEQQVLAIGLKENVILKEHKTNIPARLYVLQGEVVYSTGNSETTVKQFEDQEIRAGELHSVKALKNSVFLVIKG